MAAVMPAIPAGAYSYPESPNLQDCPDPAGGIRFELDSDLPAAVQNQMRAAILGWNGVDGRDGTPIVEFIEDPGNAELFIFGGTSGGTAETACFNFLGTKLATIEIDEDIVDPGHMNYDPGRAGVVIGHETGHVTTIWHSGANDLGVPGDMTPRMRACEPVPFQLGFDDYASLAQRYDGNPAAVTPNAGFENLFRGWKYTLGSGSIVIGGSAFEGDNYFRLDSSDPSDQVLSRSTVSAAEQEVPRLTVGGRSQVRTTGGGLTTATISTYAATVDYGPVTAFTCPAYNDPVQVPITGVDWDVRIVGPSLLQSQDSWVVDGSWDEISTFSFATVIGADAQEITIQIRENSGSVSIDIDNTHAEIFSQGD